MSKQPPLDTWRFDALTTGQDKVWGLEAIAKVLGVSVSKARKLAKRDAVPIFKPDGERYFAFRSELIQWLRTK